MSFNTVVDYEGKERLTAAYTYLKEVYPEFESYIYSQPTKKPKTVYLIGSLRNSNVPVLGDKLRAVGYDVFDEWHGAGHEADDAFQNYRLGRGLSYRQALNSYSARHIFNFDKTHLDRSDCAVLVMPAGKSGHLEAGYMCGKGKPVFVLFDGEPERFDQMYQFCTDVCFSDEELINCLKSI